MYSFTEEATLLKMFCLPCQQDSTIKRQSLLASKEQIYPPPTTRADSFLKGIDVQVSKKPSQKLSTWKNMAENLPSVTTLEGNLQ